MRIVNPSGFNLTSSPGERCVAARTVHLIATIDFVDRQVTVRAGLCVTANQLNRCNRIGIAFGTLVPNLPTAFASLFLTDTAPMIVP